VEVLVGGNPASNGQGSAISSLIHLVGRGVVVTRILGFSPTRRARTRLLHTSMMSGINAASSSHENPNVSPRTVLFG